MQQSQEITSVYVNRRVYSGGFSVNHLFDRWWRDGRCSNRWSKSPSMMHCKAASEEHGARKGIEPNTIQNRQIPRDHASLALRIQQFAEFVPSP